MGKEELVKLGELRSDIKSFFDKFKELEIYKNSTEEEKLNYNESYYHLSLKMGDRIMEIRKQIKR